MGRNHIECNIVSTIRENGESSFSGRILQCYFFYTRAIA